MGRLARWVGEVLVPSYQINRRQLLDCWPRHPAMVAELTWVRHTYLEAHLRGAPATKAQDWHLRGLPGAFAALEQAIPRDTGPREHAARLCAPDRHMAKSRGELRDHERYMAEYLELATVEHWGEAWREVRDADIARRRPAPTS